MRPSCHSERSVTISTLWDFCHLEKSLDFVKIYFFRFSRHFVAQNDQICHSERSVTIHIDSHAPATVSTRHRLRFQIYKVKAV